MSQDPQPVAITGARAVAGVVAPTTRWRASPRDLLGRAAGWTLVLVGIALMPLPGPGTLVVVAGLRMLVPHHRWAAASYARLLDRAVAAGRAGVRTPARVLVSILGVVWVAVLAGLYALDVRIPETSVLGLGLGPSLPLHSTGTVIGLVISCLASAGATLYGIVRLRPPH